MRNLLMSTTSPLARLFGRADVAGPGPVAEGGATRFAHLLGRGAKALKPAAAKAEDDKDDDKAEDDTDEDKKAEDKTDDDKAEDDKDDDKAEDADDDQDAAVAAIAAGAVTAERARGAAIFAAGSAGKRPDLAAHLAFETDMTAAAAVALLDKVAAGTTVVGMITPRARLAERMGRVETPNVGSDRGAPAAGSPEALAAGMVGAYEKALGTPAKK
jgi:hypothetical protein